MSLDSFLKTSRPTPKVICTSAPIQDRDSTFVAGIYPAASPAAAHAAAKYVKHVVHAANRASHEIMAYRTVNLKPDRDGLQGPDDFEVKGKNVCYISMVGTWITSIKKGGSDDDGEKYGGSRVLKIMQQEGVLDAVVVVSRWYGGSLLGPVRFTHIETCTREVCVGFKAAEELQGYVERLHTLDQTLANLRANLAGDNSTTPSKSQDYSGLGASLDLAKARRLIKARESAIRSVETILKGKGQQVAFSEENRP